jgi:putative FmdB family regulatory protein
LPLYEYQCRKCGHRFEKIQKFSDAAVKKCPECGGAVEKLLSAPAVQFKGSGWYVTDYARKGAAAAGESADGAGKSAGEKSESKAEGEKAESKTESKTKPEPHRKHPAKK